jgi:signal peptidase I
MAMGGWAKPVVDTAAIVLIVLAAKTAIAEPYYVPSGSMEPTLQIGDELLATKYPYGYSSASLPPFITLPERSASSPRCPSAATSWCFAGRATGRRFG